VVFKEYPNFEKYPARPIITQIFPGIYFANMAKPCDITACLTVTLNLYLVKILYQLNALSRYPDQSKNVDKTNIQKSNLTSLKAK
jgi:hypothetical protein